MKSTQDAFIIAAARTPIGKFLGAMHTIPATELGAIAIRESLKRADISPDRVDEVVMGNVISAGLGQAPARQAALNAGLPATIPAVTVNKVCGSGLKAVMLAAQAVRLGDAQIVVAGGMESMSQAPHLMKGSRNGYKLGNLEMQDALLLDGLWCAFEDCHMGLHAEHTARTQGVTRDDQDRFALESQKRAQGAIEQRLFDAEITPVIVKHRRGETVVSVDEGPRPETDLGTLSKLKPAFDPQGTVTAGNASMLSDGAAAVVVADRTTAMACKDSSWKARIVAYHTSGVEPRDLFIAPVLAVRDVLKKAELTADDIDLFELNEAFASQMVACMKELQLDPAKVNVHGGAIALGHPIGASGARVLVTLLSALNQRNLRRGLASLCLGGGNAVAMIVDREGIA
ncbi:MAG: acetyl-CoA C-acetyltransferase [Planctomycetota bacterium]|nr:acetyl-CoA C-acetyltransferase [Planctomycetota bacterium]MDA1211339.1 acetyl-CoA C-acetyltransferase [Planctomycetota bacterium]